MNYFQCLMLAVVFFWSLVASILLVVAVDKISTVEAKTIRAFYRVDARLEELQQCRK